jgi:hypothetical protein
MQRTENELRRIALHIAERLPPDHDDARRACDLALDLKQWEDGGGDLEACGKLSVVRRK